MSNMTLEPAESAAEQHAPAISDEKRVIRQVLDRLGRPKNLYRVDAEKLWDHQYRVNVYCAVESDGPVKTVSMSDSFFVKLTSDGIESKPSIERRYA
jgi:hypothetical protein